MLTRRGLLKGLAALPFVGLMFSLKSKPVALDARKADPDMLLTQAEIEASGHRAGYTGFNFIETQPMSFDDLVRESFYSPTKSGPVKPLTVADIRKAMKALDMA